MRTSSVALTTPLTITTATILSIAIFTIPLTISGPQLLVGSVVNMFLFLAAPSFSKKQLLVFSFLPSLGAVLHGVLFGSFTSFLLFMLPFIWIGNSLLMLVSREMSKRSFPWMTRIVGSSLVKMTFLFLCAQLLYTFHLIPVVLLTAMGVLQLVTATIGGSLSYILEKQKVV